MPNKGDPLGWMREWTRPGWRVVDAGAAGGSTAEVAATATGPTGRVWAIEPDPTRSGVALVERFPYLSWHGVALGAQAEHRAFFLQGERSSFWPELASSAEETPVTVMALDTLVPPPVDLIKLDVQGAEVDVLAGARAHLRQGAVWIVELWPKGLQAAGRTAVDLYRRFAEDGYTVKWPVGHGFESVTEATCATWADSAGSAFINIVARRDGRRGAEEQTR